MLGPDTALGPAGDDEEGRDNSNYSNVFKWVVLTTGLRILVRNFIPDTLQGKKNRRRSLEPCDIFVFHYILISKEPFRNLSATQDHWTCLSRKGFLFSSLKNVSLDFQFLTVSVRVLE